MISHLPTVLLSEFLGAFLLMISILASGGNSLIIGATLAVIVFLTGGISGASVNPAVSAGLWYNGTLSTNVFLLYCVVEVVGALAATAFYSFIV